MLTVESQMLTVETRPLHALSRKADSERYGDVSPVDLSLRAFPQVEAFQRATFLCQLDVWVAEAYLLSRYVDVCLSRPSRVARLWF